MPAAAQPIDPQLPEVPYGAWPSPIAARDLTTGTSQPIDVWAENGVTWWSQSRPDEGGRQEVLRRDPDGSVRDVLPPDWNARTRVHEYGGAAWWVHAGVVFAVEWADQRLYRVEPGGDPVPLTPAPPAPGAYRYADGRLTPDGTTVICVRESHAGPGEARNEIVAIAARPDPGGPAEPHVLVSGPDFVAAPRPSADGRRLAWIEWDHPNMPWDTTRLGTGELVAGPAGPELAAAAPTGRAGESLGQPEWGPDGTLYVVSDRSDWWNVYRVAPGGELAPGPAVEAEVGQPAWVFGQSRYVVGADALWFTYSDGDGAHLSQVPTATGAGRADVTDVVLSHLGLECLRLDGERLVAIATQATAEPAIIELRPAAGAPPTVLRAPADPGLDPRAISTPRRVSFPTTGGRTAYALYHPPASDRARPSTGELPPAILTIHGGPTSAARGSFRLATQFWTTRGFAVVAVDYGGSTGYGRPFRRRLDGQWGIVDVEDACAAAAWVAAQGLADPTRLLISGGSAGGFTVLAALAGHDVFAAGASHYGVADLAALARDTHKFESRYLDGLVGPWPEAAAVYAERSPLSHVDGFDRPLIVLQGDEDEVVPPAQAELIVAALAAKGVPHAYLLFAGEQHGFRKAENIVRALEAELSFYAQVFGFEPAGAIEPVPIVHGEGLAPGVGGGLSTPTSGTKM